MKFIKTFAALSLVLGLSACSSSDNAENTIKIGASVTPHAEIIENISSDLEDLGYTVEIVEFNDYVTPNEALLNGELDCNYFQHTPYLEEWVASNCDSEDALISAASVHFEPLGIYSQKYDSIESIPQGAKIAVPNDTTNEARALQLLQENGIITLKEDAGLNAKKNDIVENPYNVEIIELASEAIPSNIDQVDFCVVNGNNALNGDILDSLILSESKDSEAAKTYANIIAIRKEDKDSKKIKDLVDVLLSDKTAEFIEESYNGIVVPTFE